MDVNAIYILWIAFVLDSIFGDPRSLPHLIVGYGNAIAWGEKRLNSGKKRFLKGALWSFLLVVSSFVVPYFIIIWLKAYELVWATTIFSILMLFYCLANRTLIKEGIAVFDALEHKGIEAGRKRLSWIVGRETQNLSEQQIRIATLETLSENLSEARRCCQLPACSYYGTVSIGCWFAT